MAIGIGLLGLGTVGAGVAGILSSPAGRHPLVGELARVQSGDVVLPTRNDDGTPGPILTVRCVTQPDPHLAVLLHRLGLRLPNHLKRFRQEDRPVAQGIL